MSCYTSENLVVSCLHSRYLKPSRRLEVKRPAMTYLFLLIRRPYPGLKQQGALTAFEIAGVVEHTDRRMLFGHCMEQRR